LGERIQQEERRMKRYLFRRNFMIYNPDDPDLTLVDRGESKDRGGSTELCGIGI
jgi:hypothetical protein